MGDYSDLPIEIFLIICSFLTFPDLLRASAVSRSWRSAVGQKRRIGSPHQQTPWLLLESNAAASTFFSLSEDRLYSIPMPQATAGSSCIGSGYGWLIFLRKTYFYLFNPISRRIINLPSTYHHTFLDSVNEEDVFCEYYSIETEKEIDEDISDYVVCSGKAILSSNPDEGDFNVFLMTGDNSGLQSISIGYVGCGDTSWRFIHTTMESQVRDVVCHQGRFYTLSLSSKGGWVRSWSFTNRVKSKLVLWDETWERYDAYMVSCPWGDLYLVSREFHRMDVYKVDTESQRLVEIDSVGNNALFVTNISSQCVSTRDFPSVKKNRVYYYDKHVQFTVVDVSCSDDGSGGSEQQILPYVEISCLDDGSGGIEHQILPYVSGPSSSFSPAWLLPNFS